MSTLSCALWCWPSNVKIVISDVDGTITRSDVMGQVMPAFGRDWSHTGVVGLYNSIQKNGYHMVYLSSRPIGSSGQTKSYLNDLRQDGEALPPGPLIVSPDRLLTVLAREVYYRRAQEFKIAALRDLKRLFPVSSSPFYAGFGNRPSDVASYGATGVPPGKIFIVDPKSQICSGNGHQLEQDYTSMHKLAHFMFPPIVTHHCPSIMSPRSSAGGAGSRGFATSKRADRSQLMTMVEDEADVRRGSTYLDPTFNSAAYWGSRAGLIESDEDDGKEDEDDANLSDLSDNSDFGVEDGEYEIDVMLAADEAAAEALSMSPDERKHKSDELEKSPAPHFKSGGHADNKSSIVSTASVD